MPISFDEALLVLETVESFMKDAGAIQNAIRCYYVIYNE